MRSSYCIAPGTSDVRRLTNWAIAVRTSDGSAPRRRGDWSHRTHGVWPLRSKGAITFPIAGCRSRRSAPPRCVRMARAADRSGQRAAHRARTVLPSVLEASAEESRERTNGCRATASHGRDARASPPRSVVPGAGVIPLVHAEPVDEVEPSEGKQNGSWRNVF